MVGVLTRVLVDSCFLPNLSTLARHYGQFCSQFAEPRQTDRRTHARARTHAHTRIHTHTRARACMRTHELPDKETSRNWSAQHLTFQRRVFFFKDPIRDLSTYFLTLSTQHSYAKGGVTLHEQTVGLPMICSRVVDGSRTQIKVFHR